MKELDKMGFIHCGPGSKRYIQLKEGKLYCKCVTIGRGWNIKRWFEVVLVSNGKIIVDKHFEWESKMLEFIRELILTDQKTVLQ